MAYWLLKSEPDTFGIDHLQQSPQQRTGWEGVRNYQARNYLRDQLQLDDLAFFYHSSCPVPGIAGVVRVCRAAHPDPSAWQPESPYFDPKSSPDNPRWFQVEVELVERWPKVVSLQQLKTCPALSEMALLKRSRLSVQPVSEFEWQWIMQHLKP
ncbi:EVE domain-containing protein [Balneatrix alpica]|uniref:EVE domain-containing protein n=1 Tax=Balneatrix alpica TaxID=75684 RepID=A0ABV5ZI54_9GAMM|nr:EVE domain-containing protein [Balneatrix alpica]